ncbi:hypothetical protein DSO57_1036222 [Entomophthora muscae]|uniref:Uncharacterized protein n=1 Tax=Entomophthora muscae TaxID=34485 RepID=A0ACC2S1F5_9FUNG|nr:hypothetical protein DSO57_1036222 [Entomophthora muscae]
MRRRLLCGLALGVASISHSRKDWHKARLVPEEYNDDGEMLTPEGSGVEFKLHCEASRGVCDWVLGTFASAASHVGNAIEFQVPVRVLVNFYSFCDKYNECHPKEPVIGLSRPSRFYPLSKEGQVRMYPQALMRQIYGELDDAHPFDIVMAMNADSFPNPTTPMIEVLSHELIHGLGFVSSLVQSEAGVLPWPNSSDTRLTYTEFAMDEYLFDARTNLPLSSLTSQLPLKNASADIGHYIEELATHHGYFELRVDNLSIPLETSLRPFRIGSSVSHLDSDTYAQTQDVLMIYRINKGKTVREYIRSHSKWNTAPYGPHTLKVMQAMGYTLNPSPSLRMAYSHAIPNPNPIFYILCPILSSLLINLL